VTFGRQVEALREHVNSVAPGGPVHLVAHSIGAVYAFVFADESPEAVASITSVEGNFTLRDAFWSASIAAMDESGARVAIEARLDDPAGFLAGDGIAITGENIAAAERALAYQSWATVWRSAKEIVETTRSPEYENVLRRAFDRTPVSLIGGERSVDGWDVPAWARQRARSFTVIPNVGHMMMLESPIEFGRVIASVAWA
jgi:lipase